ncbi:uncharacterized mitochondrial protein-like protein [Tanacetum coccineum]
MTTVRTLIAVASSSQWKISQTDNAFLNGDLNEEVYMKPPSRVPHKPGEVCKLRKALYGLKQAPRAWYEKFSMVVTSLGFVFSHHDSALFVELSHHFAMKDLGLLCYFLGIEVASSPKESHAYCDVDCAGDSITHKSTTGFCIFLRDSYLMEKYGCSHY